MFVPFVFSLDPSNDNYYLWIFYKFLDMAKRNNSPIIAQKRYFVNPEIFKKSGVWPVSAEAGKTNEYDIPTMDDIYRIRRYSIPEELEQGLIKQSGSQTAAWLNLIKERSMLFENYIECIIDDINERNDYAIEGILTFCYIPSLWHIAKKRNIPVLQFEWGPFRGPTYRKTAYLNFDEGSGKNELKSRYERFIQEVAENSVEFLSRKEILSIFLDYKFIENINLLDCNPEYEMGIACTYTMDIIMFAESSFLNNLELITMVKRYYDEKVISIRLHPTDPTRANPCAHLVDSSKTSMEFINRCKRISVVSSNMAFESMLWGRTAYVLGNSPYAFKAQHDLSIVSDEIVELEFINYVTFAYLIPYELMLDTEYLRWRLTNPTEIEIYSYNLNYYLKCRGIQQKVLGETGAERLRKILLVQGFDFSGKCILNDSNLDTCSSNVENKVNGTANLKSEIQLLNNKIEALNIKYKNLKLEYNNKLVENDNAIKQYNILAKESAELWNKYDMLSKESSKLWNKYEMLTMDNEKLMKLNHQYVDNCNELETQCDVLRQKYDKICNSFCWKMTASIRHFLDKIKK